MLRQLPAAIAILIASASFGADVTLSDDRISAEPHIGDQSRSLLMEETNKPVAYRLYVPVGWSTSKRWPLVVIFPGGGQTENDAFDKEPAELKGVLSKSADAYHYILLALGSQGTRLGAEFTMPKGMQNIVRNIPPEVNHSAELDAMRVIDQVTSDLNIDRARIFLIGNSMGEAVTLHFAQLYPGKWCAVAPSDGPFVDPQFPFARLSYLKGARFIHGDHDTLALLDVNRKIFEQVRAIGIDTEFVVVNGGTHQSSWYKVLPETFEYFARRQCTNTR